MPSIIHKRRETLLFKEVAEIINTKLTNANISYVTVTGVSLTTDLSILTVYVVFENNEKTSLEHLNNAKGFVRRELGKVSNLRKTPAIIFKVDTSIAQGNRIDEILNEINKKNKTE